MESAGSPHQALFLVLAYLPLHQLLSMSQVSKPLRDAIRDDVLIWLDIVLEKPLNLRVTDQILMKVTSKAHGRLRTLALLNCVKITDDGLLAVANANPHLNKLYVPACSGLTPEGVLRAVQTLTEKTHTFTRIKINGIYNFKQEHLFTLKSHVPKAAESKRRFYHKYRSSSFYSIDADARSVDVEICPRCEEVKLLFDCPRETCSTRRGRGLVTDCKGCLQCIMRCEGCGRCIFDEDDEQGETICNDVVCQNCWLHLPKCNLCNKPFCPHHDDEKPNPPSSGGFVCEICQTKLLAYI